MSTDNMVDDGTTSFYRVRIRFAAGDGWSRWHRPSAAPLEYAELYDAEEAALECWRVRGAPEEFRKEYQVEIVEVTVKIEPVSRVNPATVSPW
jgi:hypothetical protein